MRQTWLSALPKPQPADWSALIGDRTNRAFALAHGLHENRVAEYRTGHPVHWALWELLLVREGKHPTLSRRRTPSLAPSR